MVVAMRRHEEQENSRAPVPGAEERGGTPAKPMLGPRWGHYDAGAPGSGGGFRGFMGGRVGGGGGGRGQRAWWERERA